MEQRLIDANALLIRIKQEPEDLFERSDAIKIIDSAPTVETTDDVLARMEIPFAGEIVLRNNRQDNEWVARYYPTRIESMHWIVSPTNGFANTPIEAVKKLEASLNPK